jgi:hypothetical protein
MADTTTKGETAEQETQALNQLYKLEKKKTLTGPPRAAIYPISRR